MPVCTPSSRTFTRFLRSSEARIFERTLILAGLPVANVRSRAAFRIWVSGLLLASPQIYSGAWQVATALWVRLTLWVRPGANRFLGTSAQQRPFDLVFCSGVVWQSCRSYIFQIIWRLHTQSIRYWQKEMPCMWKPLTMVPFPIQKHCRRPSTLAYGDCWSSQTKPIAHCQTSKYKSRAKLKIIR